MKYIIPVCFGILGGFFLTESGYSPYDLIWYVVMIPCGIIATAIGWVADEVMK